MIILLYAGPSMFGIQYNLVRGDMRAPTGAPTYRMQHYTLLFQTFMMMNLFNMINCRKLPSEDQPEWNIFSRIWDNWWFLIVFLAELNGQYLMSGYNWTGVIFGTTPLTLAMQITALLFGLGSLLVAVIAKATPYRWVKIYP